MFVHMIATLDRAFTGVPQTCENRLIEQYSADYPTPDAERIFRRMADPASGLRCLISTIGFGMGVDCRDVDLVCLWGCPQTILEYWQCIGKI